MPSSFRFPTSNREALAHVDPAELIALTRDLIRIPSVVRPGDPVATEAAVAEYVERWLTKEGLSVEVQPVAAGRPNVLGWIGEPSAGRTLLVRALAAAGICEPEQNELCLEQRGVVWARVTVRGRMAHGAMPEAGANPIAALGTVLSQAPRLERRLRRLCRPSPYLRPPTVT